MLRGLIVSLLFLTVPSLSEAAEQCPLKPGGATVSLERDLGDIAYHHDRDKKGLAALRRQHGGRGLGGMWSAIGYTIAELQFRLRTEVQAYPLDPRRPNGRVCAVLSNVEMYIGYPRLDVYVNRGYKQGSCQFRSVLEHEHKHVAVFRDTLAEIVPKMEKVLTKSGKTVGIVTAPDLQTAANRAQRKLQALFQPHLEALKRAQERRNNNLDTKANYRREQRNCTHW